MTEDKVILKSRGYVMQFILQGGGVKNFILLLSVVGVLCFLFAIVVNPFVAFGFFGIVVLLILGFLFYLASTPEGRLFFLDSNAFVKVVKLQMSLIGDSATGLHEINPKTKFAQPILSVPKISNRKNL